MSAAGHSSSPPTSAAVLEFICLFTHDLRRKQKRWQDGRLKYHTFNNRVMVYDDRGNFVGDMHWRHNWDLVEGEEVQLERGGVIVQVQELSSRCEQDLSELLDKRDEAKKQRQMQAVARSPVLSALPRTAVRPVVTRPIPPGHAQIRHQPLHQVMRTSSGHHGRAVVLSESPFEQRQQITESPDQPAAKRRKYEAPPPSKSGYASALFGQALTLSATPMSTVPIVRRRPMWGPDPSQEDDARSVREEPKPPLREQPKTSQHFNQPSEGPRSVGTAMNTPPSHHDVEDDDEPVRGKQERSLLRKKQIQRRRESTPVEEEVIDSDSSDTTPVMERARPTRLEKKVAKQPRARKKTSDRPAASLSRQASESTRAEIDGINGVPNGGTAHDEVSKTQSQPKKLKSSKTSMPKSVAQKTAVKSPAGTNDDNLKSTTLVPREPTVPVTELRIKSRKKRGLMMMSDLPAKPREQPGGDAVAVSRAVSDTAHAKEVEETDYSFQSPSPRPPKSTRSKEPSRNRKSSIQRANSRELGELEGTIQSPSSEAHAEADPEELCRNSRLPAHVGGSAQLKEAEDPFRSPTPPSTTGSKHNDRALKVDRDSERFPAPVAASFAEVTAILGAEGQADDMDLMATIQVDDFGATLQMDIEESTAKPVDNTPNTSSTLLPQGNVYDPYRLPSSSPEEPAELSPRVPLSPTARKFSNTDRVKDSSSNMVPDEGQSVDESKRTKKMKRATKRPLAFLRNVVVDEDDELDVTSGAPEQAEGGVNETLDLDDDANLHTSHQQRGSKKAAGHKSKAKEVLDEDSIESDLGDVPSKKPVKPKRATKATKRKLIVQDQEPGSDSEGEQPIKRLRATRKLRARSKEPEETLLLSGQEDSEEESSSKRSRKKKTSKPSEDRPRLEKIKKSVKSRELIGFDLSALKAPLGLRGIGMPFSILPSPANESIQKRTDFHAAMEPSSDHLLPVVNEQMPVATSEMLQSIAKADAMTLSAQLSEAAGRSILFPKLTTRLGRSPALAGGGDTVRSGDWEMTSDPALPVLVRQVKDSTEIEETVEGQREQELALDRNVSIPDFEQSKDLAPAAHEGSSPVTKGVVAKPFVPPSKATAVIQDQSSNSVPVLTREAVTNESEVEGILEAKPAPAVVVSLPAFKTPRQKPIPTLQLQSSLTANVNTELEGLGVSVQEEVEENTVTIHVSAASALPAFKRPGENAVPALKQQSSLPADIQADVESHHSDDERIAWEITAEEIPNSYEERADKPPPALRRQAPTFKPPSKAKVKADQPGIGSNAHSDQPGTDTRDTELDKAVSTRTACGFSRSNSAIIQVVEGNAAADGSDATESTRADPGLALPVPRQNRVSLQRTASVTRRINNLTVEPPQSAIVDDPTIAERSTKPAPNARIANPASRGRKAAVKSDAKGPVPQRMLPPTQPFAMVPGSTADFASTPIEEPAKGPARPKKKMTFPGFQSARDEGPWSREAFDLLESGRPG